MFIKNVRMFAGKDLHEVAMSTVFNRWKPRAGSSWALRVFKKHTIELLKMHTAFNNSYKYTYENLGKSGAEWNDSVGKHFYFDNPFEYDKFSDLKDWSNSFNELDNWMNLNALVAISSNLETYIATIVPFALESDIGVLYGIGQHIDGVTIVKHGNKTNLDFDNTIKNCTMGSWQSRINNYEKTFGYIPQYLKDNLSDLDKIRNIRNNVAHAFGRDIESARQNGNLTPQPIEKLSREKFLKFQKVTWKTALEIDKHLYIKHIGEYQALIFYHHMYPSLNHEVHPSIRAMHLKKELGRYGDVAVSKQFCKDLVNYYEKL